MDKETEKANKKRICDKNSPENYAEWQKVDSSFLKCRVVRKVSFFFWNTDDLELQK